MTINVEKITIKVKYFIIICKVIRVNDIIILEIINKKEIYVLNMKEDMNKFEKTDKEIVDELLLCIQDMLKSLDEVERVYKQIFEPLLEELLSRYEKEEDIPGYKLLKLMVDTFDARSKNIAKQ